MLEMRNPPAGVIGGSYIGAKNIFQLMKINIIEVLNNVF